jgi:anti-sigma factor RsiW
LVELVTDYLEGRLSRRDRKRFDAHIGVCDGCTAYLAQMRRTIVLTGRLTEEQIPEPAKAKLLEVFREWKTA